MRFSSSGKSRPWFISTLIQLHAVHGLRGILTEETHSRDATNQQGDQMKLIIYILLMGLGEFWTYSYLYDVLSFSNLVALYTATTALGAVMLFIRYPACRAAKNASKKLYNKWKEKQKDPEFIPSADDIAEQKIMAFVYVYFPALALIVIPGIVTDVIGMLLLVPDISKRCTAKISGFNFYRVMQFSETADDHPEAQVNVGYFLWIRLGLVLAICVSFIWLWGLKGAIAAVFTSIAVVITLNQIWRFYRSYAIHANGLHGYNKAKESLRQYNRGGAQHHLVMRGYWMQKWAYFLYNTETMRWSWRPYALFCALAGIFYWSSLLGGAIVAAFVSMILKAINDISVPTVLYLGSSDPKSHEMLRKLRVESGIEWVSLLDDSVITDMPSDSHMQEIDPLTAAAQMYKTNRWSLRMNEAEDWMAVVKDFIRAAAVIVVRPENEGAVRDELEVLENAEYPQRIILIRTECFDEERLPEKLRKCVLDGDEAMALISLIKSRPKIFRERIRKRFGKIPFETLGLYQAESSE